MASPVSLHVTDSGSVGVGDDAPTLVFLHHYGGSSRTWTEVIDVLRADFRCVAADLRGFGDSPTAPPGGGYTVDENADDVIALVESLGLTHYLLVGHSMGGKFALAVAARTAGTPLSPLALLLCAPSPPTPEPMTDDERAQTRAAWGKRDAALATVAKITGASLPPPIALRTVADMLRVSHDAWGAWEDAGSKENIADRMGAITIPTHILVGDKDPVVPADVQTREVVARLADTRLTVIPGAGHLLPLEATGEVARAIRDVAG